MGWTTFVAGDTDADSPIIVSLMKGIVDNFAALAAGDSGAPEIVQGALKTTTGEVSTASSSYVSLTLPGGEYGFWPNTKETGDGMTSQVSSNLAQQGSTYGCFIAMRRATTGTVYAQQRYIQASPPYDLGNGDIPIFIFLAVDKTTKEIISTYIAEDPPWANNGPTSIRPTRTDFASGRKYKLVRKLIEEFGSVQEALKTLTRKQILQRLLNDPMVEIEITQAIKQADMVVIPHPFGKDNNLYDNNGVVIGTRNQVFVLLDPLSNVTAKLHRLHIEEGDSIAEILHGNYLTIGNADVGAIAPPGVIPVSVSFK